MKMRVGMLASSVALLCCALPVNAAVGLIQLYQQAQARDAQLAQAQAQFQADQEMLNQAKAFLLPSVTGQVAFQQNEYSSDNVAFALKDSLQQKLTVSQSLYDASAWSRYDQAKALVEKAAAQLSLQEQSLMLRLTQAYFDVLRADQLLVLAQAQKASTQKQRDKIAEGVRVGLTNPVDLLEIQARYDLAVSDTIQAENQVAVTREALSRLVDAPTPDLKRLSLNTRFEPLKQSPADLAKAFSAQSLSVKLGQQQLRVAELEVDAQRAGHYPTLSLQGNITQADNSYLKASSFTTAYQTNSLGVQLNVPIYAGGMVDSKVVQSTHQRTSAQAGLRQAQEQAHLDIITAAKSVQLGQSRLAALRQAVASGEAFLNAAEEGNRVGMKDLVDVLNARTQLLKAKQDLANALYDDVLNRVRLKSAQGVLQSEDLAVIEAYLSDAP
jgi:outer membrane protein